MNRKGFYAVVAANALIICGLSVALIVQSRKVATPVLVFDPCWDIRERELHIFVAMKFPSHEEVVKFTCDSNGSTYMEKRWVNGVKQYGKAAKMRFIDTLSFQNDNNPTRDYDPKDRIRE